MCRLLRCYSAGYFAAAGRNTFPAPFLDDSATTKLVKLLTVTFPSPTLFLLLFRIVIKGTVVFWLWLMYFVRCAFL